MHPKSVQKNNYRLKLSFVFGNIFNFRANINLITDMSMRLVHSLVFSALLMPGILSVGANAQQIMLNENNIDEVVKAMTLEEKAALLVGGQNRQVSGQDNRFGNLNMLCPGAAGVTQDIDRLGITPTALSDGPAGIRINPTRQGQEGTFYATGFPVGTAMASTWNTPLIEEVGAAMGQEVLEYGTDVLLAPALNIHRSPLCGRNFEYYSEDPVVAGKSAAAFIRGVQSNGVGTSAKHFAANSQETNRMEVDEIIDARTMREIYLKGFEIAVKEGDPWTIMSSYNKINGKYAQAHKELLTTVLRDEWGYQGLVMTDWTGQRNTAEQIQAGNDLMEPGNVAQTQEIIDKVKSGELSMADVDVCVKRMLRFIVKTPHFKGYKNTNKPDLKAHAALTRQAADEAMVLLKNEGGALPFGDNVKKVALFGVTSYDLIAGGTGSGDVNKAYVISLDKGLADAGLQLNQNLANMYKTYMDYDKAMKSVTNLYRGWGSTETTAEVDLTMQAIQNQAREADIAVITIGRQAGEGGDRHLDNFEITDVERRMLSNICQAFHIAGKKVVVVLNMGNVIETASWKGLPDAILMAWQPGQEAGYSIADILTGKANPSGKLTMTFPISVMDHPSSANFPLEGETSAQTGGWGGRNAVRPNIDRVLYKEGVNVGYRYFNTVGKEVSYPFGYGLSYTCFEYSKPTVKAVKDGFVATVTVRNTGKVAGKEVVQLYVSAPQGSIYKPSEELKAYAKTRLLEPGESETLSFNVTNYDIASFHNDSHSWISDKGVYTVKFGASSLDIRATSLYKLAKDYIKVEHEVFTPTMSLE